MLRTGFLENAHNLRRPRRIERANLALRLEPMTADDQVILMPQLADDQLQCTLHLAGIFMCLEVDKRFIDKPAFWRAQLNIGRKGHSSHNEIDCSRASIEMPRWHDGK